MFWTIYYIIYIVTSIRFFCHTGVLAFPIPRQRFKYKKSKKKILIQYPVCNEPIELIHRFLNSLETIPKKERGRILLQICDDSKSPIPFKSLSACVRMVYKRRWDNNEVWVSKLKNKASNLNYGLMTASAEYEYVAIYDTDHIMEGEGLIKAADILEAESNTACVQSRWVMNNLDNSFLSMLQDQIIGTHLEREQTFRGYWNLYPIFNGAGALWRRDVLDKETNGLWLTRTVCEDTDLSGVVNMRNYRIKILSTWITKIDNATTWKEYKKQQSRWIKANGQQTQYHIRDTKGWGLKKLYWLSWNLGFFFAPSKYIVPIVMAYKYFTTGFIWLDWLLSSTHLFGWIASCLYWDNTVKWKGLVLYPLHYVLEQRVLFTQIKAWWTGFLFYKKQFVFEVTKKQVK